MLLTFSTKLTEILEKQKWTTIRQETPTRKHHWDIHSDPTNTTAVPGVSETVENTWGEKCHLWWLNPRNRSKYCRKIGESDLVGITRKKGEILTNDDALADGFDSLDDLIEVLGALHNMSWKDIKETVWYINEWDSAFSLSWKMEKHLVNAAMNKRCQDEYCPACKDNPRCKCGHRRDKHRDGTGYCSGLCQCTEYHIQEE